MSIQNSIDNGVGIVEVASGVAILDSNKRLPSSNLSAFSFNTQSGTTYTAAATDINNVIYCTNTGTCTVTFPSDTNNPNIYVGAEFQLTAASTTGVVSVFPDSGVTIQAQGPTSLSTSGPYINLHVRKIAANTYMVVRELDLAAGSTNGLVKWDGTRLLGATNALMDSSERITNSAQPLVSAYVGSNVSNVTGDGSTYQIIFNTTQINQGSIINTSTGVVTAPKTANYFITGSVGLSNLGAGHTAGILNVVATVATYQVMAGSYGAMRDSNNNLVIPISSPIIPMTANNTVHISVTVTNSTKTVGILGSASPLTFLTVWMVPS